MPALILNDTIMVTLNGLIGSHAVANVIHVRADRPIEPGNSESIAQRVSDAWQTHVVNGVAGNAYTYTGADYIDLDSLTGDSGSVPADPALGVVGNQGASVPPNVSLIVRKVTEGAPRGTRGRLFVAAIPETVVDGAGLIGSAALAQFQAAFAAFLDAVHSSDMGSEQRIVLATYPRDTSGNITGPGTTYDVSSFNVQTLVGSQRDRLNR